MTISYQYSVANSTFCGFAKLLLKWKGSIYKLIFKELVLFSAVYAGLSITYRLLMTDLQKGIFEKAVLYCESSVNLIPLSFILGFYVTFVVTRWWNQFMHFPWPDRVIYCVALFIEGNDERGRLLRRTLSRYLLLMVVLTTRYVSVTAVKRFPTLDHVVDAGFMTKEEKKCYEDNPCNYSKFWIPGIWFLFLIKQCVKEKRINEGANLKLLLEEFFEFRSRCGMIWNHDWVSIPLVYTQVVTIATYAFFATCLVSRQYLDVTKNYPGHNMDLYIPFFTLLQFIFYMGWLKVAEQLINPYGEDDDDFEINWFFDRHTQVSYIVSDYMWNHYPSLEKDMHWNTFEPVIPHTEASIQHKSENYMGSTIHLGTSQYDHDHPDELSRFPSLQSLFRHPGALRRRFSKDSTRGYIYDDFPKHRASDIAAPVYIMIHHPTERRHSEDTKKHLDPVTDNLLALGEEKLGSRFSYLGKRKKSHEFPHRFGLRKPSEDMQICEEDEEVESPGLEKKSLGGESKSLHNLQTSEKEDDQLSQPTSSGDSDPEHQKTVSSITPLIKRNSSFS